MIQQLAHTVRSRFTRHCAGDEAFLDLARDLAERCSSVILASGGTHELSTLSLAALRPVLLFSAKGRRCTIETSQGIMHFEADPFDTLESLGQCIDHTGTSWREQPILAGYVSYEAGRLIETLPTRSHDDLNLPDLLFILPSVTIVHERAMEHATVTSFDWTAPDGSPLQPLAAMEGSTTAAAVPERTGWTREEYLAAARRVRDYIYEGDVYQVNLSQRFIFPLQGEAAELWRHLFRENPGPFFAWIDAPGHRILSSSMERLFRIDGRRIETRPIKGTRPRGSTAAEDERLGRELLSHPKDDAELCMIVDLERNDLVRFCSFGSVNVTEHKRLERYANVQHLVSVIEGRLMGGKGLAEVFRAMFPGGSITGCPKIRAMEIIDELEPVTRHVYTGAIGYIAAEGHCDFSIAIRTAIVKDNMCHLSVGGGIVYDSDLAEEYLETIYKGRTFFAHSGVDPSIIGDIV